VQPRWWVSLRYIIHVISSVIKMTEIEDRFLALEERIDELEDTVLDLESTVESLEDLIDEHEDDCLGKVRLVNEVESK